MSIPEFQRPANLDLSIIIVSWNTNGLLDKCLQTIYDTAEAINLEVFVVDNNSTDGSPEMVRQKYPQVRLLANKDNVGFARANNQAIRQSQGEYILLLNPDTEVKPTALTTQLAFLKAHAEVGAVGPLTLNPDNSLQTSCYPTPTIFREFWRLLHFDVLLPYGTYRMSDWSTEEARSVEVLLGACLLVRRTVLEQIGLLDEGYFIYTEEVDLCYRIQKAGWSLYWVPEAQIIHYGGQSTQQVATQMFLRLYESKLLFFRKHYGWFRCQVYKGVLFITAVPRVMLSMLAWFERYPPRRKHLMHLAYRYFQLMKLLPTL